MATEFSQEVADAICERLSDGKSLRSICADDTMPSKTSVFRWLADNATFRDQYARARELQAETLVDEIVDISDDSTNDYITKTNTDGSTYEQLNSEHIQRARLRVDSRKWLAGKLKPKVYGEKSSVEVTGKDGSPLLDAERFTRAITGLATRGGTTESS